MIFIFSFGKLSPTNTVLTPLAPTRVPPTSSWNASMSTIMKPPVVNMSLALFWLIWSQEPWIQSDLVRNILKNITMTSKFQRSLSWNIWVLHTEEQSFLICYHFKWGKPKIKMPSKLSKDWMWKNLFILILFLLLHFNKSVKILKM